MLLVTAVVVPLQASGPPNNSAYCMKKHIHHRFQFAHLLVNSLLSIKRFPIKKNHHYTLWENPFTYKKIVRTLSLFILPILIFTGYHTFTTHSLADSSRSFDVVVVGGGTGGVSAAIQAARNGASVAIVEETDWIGGQMTAGGVGTLDEGMDWSTNPATGYERNSGIYKEFLDQITAKYGGIQNLHKCYYGNFAICFEPKVGQDVLSSMLSNAGVQVFTREKVTSALKSGTTVTGIVAHNTLTNSTDQFNAKVVIDATEYGDVIPLTGAAYRAGKSTSSALDLNAPIQDITYKLVMKRYDTGIPANLKITQEPPNYQAVKPLFAGYLSQSAPIRDWGDGVTSPYTNPRSWVQYIAYRGIADSSHPSSLTVGSFADAAALTKSGINLANDYPATVRFLEDPANRTQVTCEAKLRTIQMLYYIQQEMAQNWSVDTDEGFDTSYNQTQNNCANIPAAFKEIEKRMPLIPYVRESRRIIGVSTITSASMRAQKTINRSDSAAVNAVDDQTSIALGGYTTDLHCMNGNPCTQDQFDSSIDSISDMLPDTHSLFQVPLGALIPQTIDGFIAAEKNISQGRIPAGATRLQPITILTGQAAGALAAIAAKSNRQPRTVTALEVQQVLLAANDPLTLYKFNDAPQGGAFWQSIHIASLYGIMTGNGGNFNTPDTLDRGTAAIILTRLFNITTNGTTEDAITQLRNRGISKATSNTDFAAQNPLLKGQLALFIARGLGKNPADATAAFTWTVSQGISVGCQSSACEQESVSRGQMAETVTTSLPFIGSAVTPVTLPPPTQVQPTPTTIPTTTANDPIGNMDGISTTGQVTGWGCDVDATNHTTDIHFYADGGGFGTFLGVITAKQTGEAALAPFCAESTSHRFTFDLPTTVKDGKPHNIYAYAIGVGGGAAYKLLSNAPRYFQNGGNAIPSNTSPQLTGWQDYVTPTGDLVGWACDKANNSSPVRIDIYIDGGGFGQFIGSTTADKQGDDSATLVGLCGGGNGNRRYIFPLPDSMRNTGNHTIYTYAISAGDVTHILIPNSGQAFSLGNKDPYGFPDYVDTTGRALGWVCDPDDFNQAVTVHFYLDGPVGQGTFIGQATASIPDEKAVGYFCGGVNAHRFAWTLPESALTGSHQLYVYGSNIGTGNTQLLGGGPISTTDRKQAPAGL